MPAEIQAPKVAHVREDLAAMLSRYRLVSDCVSGQEKIKNEGETYLPKPNAGDTSPENETRFEQYKERAVFYNVTGRTLQGMVGTVFQKAPEKELPPALKILTEDADGGGVGLDQQSKKALSYVLQFGRAGLLVDYPKTAGVVSVADLQAGKVRPNVTLWQPWDVINWRVGTVGGRKVLTLVVIAELYAESDDGFATTEQRQFRVLRLRNGVYFVEIWRENEKGNAYEIAEQSTPTDAGGKPWNVIPFKFIGSENNDENLDCSPLYDLAALNIAHYRNSADYEEACYLLGQPTPWASGLTQEWVSDVMKGKIAIGSRAVIPLPQGGQCGLLQVQPNTMPGEAMERKEKQMVALGAKLVEQRDVRQTATEASQNSASETSVLATSANNVSAAYLDALKWACAFVGASPAGLDYRLNVEFEKRLATAQDRAQLVAEWQANAITQSEMRSALKKIGVATLDDEAFRAEIETAGPDLGTPVNVAKLEMEKQKAAPKPASAAV